MTTQIADISPGQAAKTAGIGYVFIIVLAIFAEFFVRTQLVIPGDATTTTSNLLANTMLFRVGITSYLIAAIFDVVVALALYVLLRPVNRSLALLAAWLRLVHATIFGMALQNLFSVLHLLSGARYLKAFKPEEIQAQVMLSLDGFNDGWLVGLVFFGLHCLVLGYLIIKSDYMPKVLGLLLALAAVGYLTDSFAHFLLRNYSDYEAVFLAIVGIPAIVAEVALCAWLLWKGSKLQLA